MKDIEILSNAILELQKEAKFAEERVIQWNEEAFRLKKLHAILLKAHEKLKDDIS